MLREPKLNLKKKLKSVIVIGRANNSNYTQEEKKKKLKFQKLIIISKL